MEKMFDEWTSNTVGNLNIPTDYLIVCLEKNKGLRIGQSTVVSRKMHIYDARTPEEITVLQDVDAGRVFYGRNIENAIIHMDIFHEIGAINHKEVAKAIKKAIEKYILHQQIHEAMDLGILNRNHTEIDANFIDVQTSTGGGRITGDLVYGTKASLRKAHENHVHVVAMLKKEQYMAIFYIVHSVERTIINSGLELRCNERIKHKMKGTGGQSCDMSAYSDHSDSYLKEKQVDHKNEQLRNHQFLQDIKDLGEDFDSTQEIRETMKAIEQGMTSKQILKRLEKKGLGSSTLSRLKALKIIEAEEKKVSLTNYGKEFKSFIEKKSIDLEAHVRKTLRLFKPINFKAGLNNFKRCDINGGKGKIKEIKPYSTHEIFNEIAVTDTIYKALVRNFSEGQSNRLAVIEQDIHHIVRSKQHKMDIFLVIDASASMSGQRIKAAKFLARHLLVSTTDRVSIIIFQNDKAKIAVPLTRDYNTIEEKIAKIVPFGSTPMSNGLNVCLKYLESIKATNPFIVLITDGIPTIADISKDPFIDVLQAAQNIKEKKYAFTSLGLKPHADYLLKVAKAAGGTSYILDELEKHALVTAVWNERSSIK